MRELLLFALLLQQPQVPTTSTGVVSGTIFYSDGTPAPQKILRLVPGGQQPRNVMGISDAMGNFNIRVAPGQYSLSVSATTTIFYPGVLNQADAKPIVVTTGAVTGGLSFTLPPSASGVRIRGRVAIPADYPTPSSELRVEALRQGIRAPIAADGTF